MRVASHIHDLPRALTTELEATKARGRHGTRLDLKELAGTQQRMLILIRALRAGYLALGGFASAALLSLFGAVLAPRIQEAVTSALEIVVLVAGLTAVTLFHRTPTE